MGKNKILRSLLAYLSNIVIHKIVIKNTNRAESRDFVGAEINAYRNSAIKKARKLHLADYEKSSFREKLIEEVRNEFGNKYPDIPFSEEDMMAFVNESIGEVFN